MTARNFLLVGDTRAILVQVLLALHTFTDANCIVICGNGLRFLRLSNLVSDCLHLDLRGPNDDEFVEIANSFASTLQSLSLIPADCAGAGIIGRVRARLIAAVTPSPDSATLDRFNNKWTFYQFCKENNLNAPLTRFYSSKHDMKFSAVASEMGTPFIVKPLSQESSLGVCLIEDETDYRRKILDNNAYHYAPLIAQRLIQGTDVGLNLMSNEGEVIALAIQQRDHPQHESAAIKFIFNPYLEKVAHVIAREGKYNGVMNVDARIEKNTGEVFLFESNPRFWRSLSASVWNGLNFAAMCLEPPAQGSVRKMFSGSADTYYHPLFRPRLFGHALFDFRGHQGRMARLMMRDMCTFGTQIKAVVKRSSLPVRP